MVDNLSILLDGQDRGFPKEDFGLQIQYESGINGIFVSMENQVTLTGAAYKYIYEKALLSYCDPIVVTVVYSCTGAASRVIQVGEIKLTECIFTKGKCSVTTKIYDDAYQSKINANKTIPFYSNNFKTKNDEVIVSPFAPNVYQEAQMFIPRTGVYISPAQFSYGWSAFNFFRIATAFMTDNEIDFESDYFLNGDGKYYMITSGKSIRTGLAAPFKTSFEAIYTVLNKKKQLGFGFKRQNGRTVFIIEKASFFRNNAPSIQLFDVADIVSRFDKERIYATIGLGSNEFKNEYEGTDGAILSFPQVPFFGFKEEVFGLTGKCNLDRKLDLVTSNVIIDTNIIEDILMNDNQGHEESPVIIEWNTYFGDAETELSNDAKPVDILGTGTFQYNSSLTNENQAANNINGVPGSIWDYYDGGPNVVYAVDNSGPESGPPLGSDHEMELSPSTQRYSEVTGHYLKFQNVFFDTAGSYIVPDRYKVTQPGFFTINADIWRRVPFNVPLNPVGSIINWQILITRIAQDGTILYEYASPSYIGSGNSDENQQFSKTFFANSGDFIAIDIAAQASLATSYLSSYSFFPVGPATIQSMNGVGVPLQGGELQPFDADAFRPAIQKFKKELSYSQVVAMLDDTAGSVAFTSEESDVLSLVNGDIVTVTIPSLGRNIATFDLKTDKI